jgi:hypothetical protein
MIDSAVRVLRATLTNQLARFAPQAYVRLTGQTGRGAAAEEGPADIARYFEDCVDDYFVRLGVPSRAVAGYLRGKTLLEYGPGDLPGVAALMVARGAEKVYCVDRFPLVRLDEKNTAALRRLIESTQGQQRERLLSCLRNRADPGAGFDPRRIEYLVLPSGLSGLRQAADLVYSRAVLEHVNDLPATLADMVQALRPGATAVHLVDLRSHGLHRSNPLDFLTWPEPLWRLMYSEKGVPNRVRVDRYRDLLKALPVDVQHLEVTRLASAKDVSQVRPQLAAPFRTVSDQDLRWLGFWLVMRRQSAGA